MTQVEPEPLPLSPECPWCGSDHGINEAESGLSYFARCCGRQIRAVDWSDGELEAMEMIQVGSGLDIRLNAEPCALCRAPDRTVCGHFVGAGAL